jgi:energy-coupling factor transporter ATP-binding protein EcfA2
MSTTSNTTRPKAQATEVAYELHTLGWKAFQNLCVTITGEVWGQTVQSFFDSHDGGRDGAFHGRWKSKEGESFEGSFTAQCKFTAKADKQLQLSDLKDELSKAKRLAARGLSDNYFLFTNARLTGVTEATIREAFQKVAGIKRFAAYGADRISLIIRESSRLRMLVPRVYGLGDLSQILDERAHDQAKEILSALGDDLAKFVITEAYQRSAKALVEHGFVLLLGEPACGKSTIAAALAIGALDEWGCSTFKVRNADDFVAHSNPHEPKQFFWVDDAFGATQFDWSSAAAWNRVFPHMHAAIRRGARVLFTSRDYIYHSARQYLKESALPVLRESQVVIHVEQLSKEEREQILYNHIRLGSQPERFKSQLKPFLSDVAAHPSFSPEIARRLGNPIFTKRLIVSKGGLDDFVAHPVELLCEIVRTIDTGSRSALALVFMRGGMLPSPVKMTADEEHAVSLMGGSASDVRNALNALDGSLIIQTIQGGIYSWRFKHPTVRDAFAAVIAEDHELMDIYLAGAPVDRLFDEVTCGDVGVQGVKVIVPSDRYELFITRLGTIDTTTPMMVWQLHRFLAFRGEREFLARYIARYPEFVSGLSVGSYLYAVSDVNVIVRLHEYGLLPETKRVAVVAAIRELAVETPDAGFLREAVRELLTPDEFAAILEDIRTKLLPDLGSTIRNWRGNYDENRNEDPENHFDELVSALKEFRDELAEHPDAAAQVESALSEIKEVIDELRSDQPQEPDSDDFRGETSGGGSDDDSRSVFDDVYQ